MCLVLQFDSVDICQSVLALKDGMHYLNCSITIQQAADPQLSMINIDNADEDEQNIVPLETSLHKELTVCGADAEENYDPVEKNCDSLDFSQGEDAFYCKHYFDVANNNISGEDPIPSNKAIDLVCK